MGQWIENVACTNNRCGSSDAMAIYLQDDGKRDGFCFSCSHYDPDPYKEGYSKTIKGEPLDSTYFDVIKNLPTKAEAARSLSQETMSFFGIRTELSETDGQTIVAHHYPYYKNNELVAFKTRKLPKDFYTVGSFKNCDLFGEQQAKSGGKRLFITEGELDAASLYQVLKNRSRGTQWESLVPAVVSLNSGTSSAIKDLSRRMDFIKGFKEVVLVFDQDDAGREAVTEALKIIPEALVAKFKEKDASDMLIKGKSHELMEAVLFNAKGVKPSSVVGVEDVFDRATALPTMGLEWPWPSLTKLTYGIHRKKLYGLGAGVGLGKTDWVKELQSDLVLKKGLPIGAFMLEEDVGRTLKNIAGKFRRKQFHKPDGSFTQEELTDAINSLKGKVFLFDHFGVKDWDDIKAAIRYMVVVEGIKDVFLDPLTALVSHLHSSEANDELNRIMGDAAGLTHELDFTLYYTAHLNPPQSGPPHERGGAVHESQFTGSRGMMRYSHYLFGIERNKDPELAEEVRNTSQFVLLKDREYGDVGKFPIFYDKYSGSYLEPARGAF